jgi:hypothetical protein
MPTEGEGLRHLASGKGRLRPVKEGLSDCTGRKLTKARARKTASGDNLQTLSVSMPKMGETSTETLNRTRNHQISKKPQGLKWPRDIQEGTDQYKNSYLLGNRR